MSDFCITAVNYSQNRRHIEYVTVREEKPDSVGLPRVVARAFVADLIRLGKATFMTRKEDAQGVFQFGAHVHLIGGQYLSTDKNSTENDNLANLPEF